jgi:hypothetical protein
MYTTAYNTHPRRSYVSLPDTEAYSMHLALYCSFKEFEEASERKMSSSQNIARSVSSLLMSNSGRHLLFFAVGQTFPGTGSFGNAFTFKFIYCCYCKNKPAKVIRILTEYINFCFYFRRLFELLYTGLYMYSMSCLLYDVLP